MNSTRFLIWMNRPEGSGPSGVIDRSASRGPGISLVWMMLACSLLLGCCAPPPPRLPQREYHPLPAYQPTYRELAVQHNRNLEGLDRLWIRTAVSMNWVDPDGSSRFERADDSRLILQRPSNLALAVGSSVPGVGTLLWAGCDDERYWLFDLREENRVYWGHHRNIGRPCSLELALPMHPRDTPRLLGLAELDPDHGGHVWWDYAIGGWVIEPTNAGYRVLVQHETGLPMRVDLLDEAGYSRLVCLLNADRQGSQRAELPPRRVDVLLLDSEERLTLEIREVDRNPSRRRLNENQFSLESLMDSFRPGQIKQLDEACD